MNILHVVTSCNPSGGGVIEGVKQITSVYKIKGIKYKILSCDNPKDQFLKDKNLSNVIPLGPKLFNYSYTPKLIPWLNNNLELFDLVIVDGLWQYHNYAVWKIAKLKKIPYFIFTHGMLDPWFNKKYPLKFLKKILFWWFIQYRVLKDARKVLFTSVKEQESAKSSFWPYHVKTKVVGYGIQGYSKKIKKNLFLKKFHKLKNKNIILFLGRVVEKKGLDLLLKAFNKIKEKNDHIVIVGSSDKKYELRIKHIIKNNKLNKFVTWTGPLYGHLKWDAFRAANLFCLPSHQENFGISVAESLSCGTPVLISNKVNIFYEIKKYRAGFIDDNTIEGTTRSLKKWKQINNRDYKQMSLNSLKCFKDNFKIFNSVDKILNLK